MYELFSSPPRRLGGQIVVPRFKDVSLRIKSDVEKVVDFYQHGTFFAKTDHLLVRLISAMNVPLRYDLDHYYDVAVARTQAVCNGLSLTSSVHSGKWFKGIFYKDSDEVVIGYVGENRPMEAAKDWRRIQAVKVLDHPVSNLKYMIPNGNGHNIEEGLAVISIDLPLLMVQYRCFMETEHIRQLEDSEGPVLGARDFIGKYVLPNMLYSQTDIAIINRLVNLHTGAPMGDSRTKHPFFTSDYTLLLDRGLEEVLDRISTLKMRYRDLLGQIPSVFNDFPLQMPDIAETRQVWWALFLARWKMTKFLFEVGGEEARHYNQSELNVLKIDLKRFASDNVFKAELTADMFGDFNYETKQILAAL